jgi:hypothetical protein
MIIPKKLITTQVSTEAQVFRYFVERIRTVLILPFKRLVGNKKTLPTLHLFFVYNVRKLMLQYLIYLRIEKLFRWTGFATPSETFYLQRIKARYINPE